MIEASGSHFESDELFTDLRLAVDLPHLCSLEPFAPLRLLLELLDRLELSDNERLSKDIISKTNLLV